MLNNIKLTVHQWFTVSLMAFVGLLLILLRYKSSALRKAHTDLAIKSIDLDMQKRYSDIESKRKAYEEEKNKLR